MVGCAFDLAHINYDPAKLDVDLRETRSFILKEDVVLNALPCGFDRTLKKEKKWEMIGHIDRGTVYKPIGHCFTIECSNIFEAYLVIHRDQLFGFYLPVEKGFVDIKDPVDLPIQSIN